MAAHLNLAELERKICEIVARYGAVDLSRVTPESQPVAEFGIDSLELIEMLWEIEEVVGVSVPAPNASDPIVKAVFTRKGLRVADLAELAYLGQDIPAAPRRKLWRKRPALPTRDEVPFTQLGGVWRGGPLFEATVAGQSYRRLTDGMRCILIPAATVEIGSDMLPDEQPPHVVEFGAFLIDAEPVSTTAYCRFLNTIGPVDDAVLAEWFALPADDKRRDHVVLARSVDDGWLPVPGAERLPMVLVAWQGANAYSAWANGHDWCDDVAEFLPSEAQWEYAARGLTRREFPWGNAQATPDLAVFGRHTRGDDYTAAMMPMAAMNDRLGMSPFGLHHMAGNVWHWCRDWYAADFYGTLPATMPDAVNVTPTGIRSERGGSWVGPAELCRSSYRRGRPPHCRGRCLGFRCVSNPQDLMKDGAYKS